MSRTVVYNFERRKNVVIAVHCGNKLGNKKSYAPPPAVLRGALECIICLDAPASPIHRCENGHITCGICAENVALCGICRTRLQVSVLAERLSRQLDLTCNCPNFYTGCVSPIAAAYVKDHLANCYYRDMMTCALSRQEPLHRCGDKIPIGFRDYSEHLQTAHGVEFVEIFDGEWTSRDYFCPMDGDEFEAAEAPSIDKVIKKNNQTFFFHSHNDGEQYRFWVTMLGNDKEAEKFTFQLKISGEIDASRKVEQYSIPVLAYYDYSKSTEGELATKCVLIPPSHFALFGAKRDSYPNNYFFLRFDFTLQSQQTRLPV